MVKMLEDKKIICGTMIKKAISDMDYGSSLLGKVSRVSGRGQFKNLFWWRIELDREELKDKYKKSGYDYLYLTPYIVRRENVDELFDFTGEYILKNKDTDKLYWGKNEECSLPHLDSSTGNIHVKFDPTKWDGSIKQIILVRNVLNAHYGTKLDDTSDFQPDELLVYRFNDTKVSVPQECYYPRIDKEVELEDESLEKMLEKVTEIIFDNPIN